MNSKGRCKLCEEVKYTSRLQEIGEQVATGGSKELTTHTYYQCKDCGSLIVELRDSGLGGHGLFYQNLTKGLF